MTCPECREDYTCQNQDYNKGKKCVAYFNNVKTSEEGIDETLLNTLSCYKESIEKVLSLPRK